MTAQRIDSTKILITYRERPDADRLIDLETTVINSKGSVNIRSMGSRLDTTPVQIGGPDVFSGPYPAKVHVMTTGYFVHGTHQDLLDTWICDWFFYSVEYLTLRCEKSSGKQTE